MTNTRNVGHIHRIHGSLVQPLALFTIRVDGSDNDKLLRKTVSDPRLLRLSPVYRYACLVEMLVIRNSSLARWSPLPKVLIFPKLSSPTHPIATNDLLASPFKRKILCPIREGLNDNFSNSDTWRLRHASLVSERSATLPFCRISLPCYGLVNGHKCIANCINSSRTKMVTRCPQYLAPSIDAPKVIPTKDGVFIYRLAPQRPAWMTMWNRASGALISLTTRLD